MAMTSEERSRRLDIGRSGAEPVHQRGEAGKAGVDRRAVVDRDRLARGQAQHQERHGDAVVEMGRDQAAARRRPRRCRARSGVGAHLERHAVGGEAGRDARPAGRFP